MAVNFPRGGWVGGLRAELSWTRPGQTRLAFMEEATNERASFVSV